VAPTHELYKAPLSSFTNVFIKEVKGEDRREEDE
jgi:hypothetical protein